MALRILFEIMGYAAGKGPYGLHLLALPKLFLHVQFMCDVAPDTQYPVYSAALVADRSDGCLNR
jgi:hypothetical protein